MSWWLKISQWAVLLSMSIFVKERGVLLKVVSLSVTNLVRQLHFLLKDFFYTYICSVRVNYKCLLCISRVEVVGFKLS